MSAIFVPLLIIIVALGTILVIFGRHIPDVVRNMKGRREKGEEINDTPVDELPVNPKNIGLMQPVRKRISAKKIFVVFLNFIKKSTSLLKYLWPALRFLGKTTANFFHRVPRFKPANAKRELEVAQFNLGTEIGDTKSGVTFSQTTTDIKVLPKNSLRYPEPVSSINDSSSVTAPVGRYPKKRRIGRYSSLSTKEKAEPKETNFAEENVHNQVIDDPEKTILFEEENGVVEKKQETRVKNKRRIVGLSTSKTNTKLAQNPVTTPVVTEDLGSINDFDKKEEIVLETTPEIRKPPLVMRGEYVLDNETDEIGEQIEQGRYSVAESALIDVLSKNPRNSEAYRLLGIVYLKRKDFAQATEVFEEALRRDPQHKGLHGPLGFCYMSVGEYGKALSMYQQAHSMDETNMEYLEQLLVISSRMDRQPLAKMIAKKILALDSGHQLAKKYLERIAVR